MKWNCKIIKATLVVKERIYQLNIWDDSKKFLEGSIPIIDDLIKGNYEKWLQNIFQK